MGEGLVPGEQRVEGERKDLTINDVYHECTIAKQRITAEGARDTEFRDIDSIVMRAEAGTINANEAITKIRQVLESRGTYH